MSLTDGTRCERIKVSANTKGPAMTINAQGAYQYSIQCCGEAWIDMYAHATSRCESCGSIFYIEAVKDIPEGAQVRHQRPWYAEYDTKTIGALFVLMGRSMRSIARLNSYLDEHGASEPDLDLLWWDSMHMMRELLDA
jgi:hypothetical protein